ncbi:SO2930 family diheme c-type cytochrome [Novosphingobium sp. APW14]|uniref:SO2930 family diheme c-type cytochrome n=1 Tax=Novosphingobium sp. APW14 TaxID=3077237 RepID=UPI0028DF2D01|nr:SO2930 family diheme c-type cytochrome [Novosphingobium sp. APW14]MDT9011983.1 SO2930 family diheme c-type cytochrome [Novosphingobium sp. APW14]
MRLILAAALLAGAAMAIAAPQGGAVNDEAVTGAGYPASLADYRFFADAAAQRPAPGVTPYRLQTPLWSDGAEKLRFIYLPAGTTAKAQGDGLLDLPVGAALIKTFKLDGRLIETRVLLHRADGWVALPYQWNREQTEARLALAGARLELTTPQGQAISYAIPNKNQCKECHQQKDAVTPIGPKARNLSAAWLASFHKAGRLYAVPKVTARVPLWENRVKLAAAPVARGWLDSNCAHCHNPVGSASNSGLDLRWEQADPVKFGVMKRPVAAGRGSGGLEFDVLPGHPDQSIMLYRMGSLEGGISMPEVGRSTIDPDGQAAVTRWIREMKP